jgi:hypothetical protein
MRNLQRSLATSFLIVATFLFTLVPSKVLANETLPEGGESFDTATKLEMGEYTSGNDWTKGGEGGQTKYFYIENITPGQLINIDVFLEQEEGDTSLEVSLYDNDKDNLARNRTLFGGESFDLSWLAGTEQVSTTYYIKMFSEYKTTNFTFDIESVSRYDAGLNTDAGDSTTNALDIESTGEYKGYLGCEWSDDTKDYYKFNLLFGESRTITITPDGDSWTYIKIYNDLREEVFSASSESLGSIIQTVFEPEESGEYYLMVTREYCEGQSIPFEYTLSLEAGGTTEDTTSTVEDDTNASITILDTVDEAKSTAKKWLYIGIGVLVFILVVGAVVVYLIIKSLKKKKNEKKNQPIDKTKDQPTDKPIDKK